MKQILLTMSVLLTLTSGTMTYAEDANSEKEEFDARVEQELSKSYGDSYIIEKTGNTVRLTSIEYPHTRFSHSFSLAIAPLTAKLLALYALEMDIVAKEESPAHKPSPFIKVLTCQPDGAPIGQATVFRKDYADISAIKAAWDAVTQELIQEDKRWIHILTHR
jgi:hypothetical protein